MNISKAIFVRWRSLNIGNGNVLPVDHGHTSYPSNHSRQEARSTVRSFTTDVSRIDGHLLPIKLRISDGALLPCGSEPESILVLLPKYAIHLPHKEYLQCHGSSLLHVSGITFTNLLQLDLPHIRVSLRQSDMCEICFILPELVPRSMEWKNHLYVAD